MALCAGLVAVPASLAAEKAGAAPLASDKTLATVHVTGSHLQRMRGVGAGPVMVIDADAIARSGVTSVETLLQRLPISGGAAGNQSNAYWTENGYGTSQVNLRGIGLNRTLVLLNGRRVVNGGTGANNSVDLNMIPLAIIERIDVLKEGASAIYGADAVAGVVNIVTRHAVDGARLQVQHGQTGKADGQQQSVDLTWGAQGERVAWVASLGYLAGKPVAMASRAPCSLGEVDGALQCVGSSATLGGRALLADGTQVNFNQVPGAHGNGYWPYTRADNYNSNATLHAVNPLRRISASMFGTVQWSEQLEAFAELMWSNRQSKQQATPGVIGRDRQIRIAADHPTNPTGQDLTLLQRRLGEAGPRRFYQDVDTWRIVLGLEGRFGGGWQWDVAFNHGRNTGIEGSTNVANLDRVDDTLNGAVCSHAANAAIPCADYLGYGDLGPQAIHHIMFTTRDSGGNEQRAFNANLRGQVVELPAGWVGLAAGAEVRTDRGWRTPDPLVLQGVTGDDVAERIRGEYDVREAYVELSVPLLADVPAVQLLTANAAVRYSDYDQFGGDSNYRIGLEWQASSAWMVRATYATAFRVPTIPELFGGVREGSLTTTDPCSGWSGLEPSSIVYRNCQADGVRPGYAQAGNTVSTATGGNAGLQPEDARTMTLGVTWTPRFAPGLAVTAHWYDIRIDNAIHEVSGSSKLALCYSSPGMQHPYCSADHFTREPTTGDIDFLSARPANVASERVSGVDVGMAHTFGFPGVNARASVDVSYLDRYDLAPAQGAPTIGYAGRITGGRGSFARWRGLASLVLERGPWSGTYRVQYIGPAEDINAGPLDIGAHVPSVVYHNLQLAYAVSDTFDVALGVDNLADRKAPFVYSYTDGNTDTMTYDLPGRRWYARLGYRW